MQFVESAALAVRSTPSLNTPTQQATTLLGPRPHRADGVPREGARTSHSGEGLPRGWKGGFCGGATPLGALRQARCVVGTTKSLRAVLVRDAPHTSLQAAPRLRTNKEQMYKGGGPSTHSRTVGGRVAAGRPQLAPKLQVRDDSGFSLLLLSVSLAHATSRCWLATRASFDDQYYWWSIQM